MRPFGRGILPQSQIFLYEASPLARRVYYYALCVGHYECNADYVVNRKSYDSFLLLHIVRGKAYVEQDGIRTELAKNSFAFIDCYKPHEYGAIGSCEMYWIHFDGPTARGVYETIADNNPAIPKNFDRSHRSIIEIYEKTIAYGLIEEAEMNHLIVGLLTEFLLKAERKSSTKNEVIEEVRNYILDNPDKEHSLDALARRANMSPYHFVRLFKSQVGTTPHDYLIHTRLNLAKFYLLSSDYSIKEITRLCGFTNESGFCTCFKKHFEMTPSLFRISRHE